MKTPRWLSITVVSVLLVHLVHLTAAANDDGTRAARAFLTAWLVDQHLDVALRYVSKRQLLCAPSTDSTNTTLRPRSQAQATLRTAMQLVNRKLGKRRDLSGAIGPLPVYLRKRMGLAETSLASQFTVIEGSSAYVKGVMCDGGILPTSAPTIVVAFMFKVPENEADGMYFVFQREGTRWAVVSFDRIRQ